LLVAIIYEKVDKRGRTSYIVKWRILDEEKPFSLMGGRRWKQEDIALLVENKHDIKKVAKLLERTEDACRQKLKDLGISIKNLPNRSYVIFPKPDADLRRKFVKKLMPKIEAALVRCLKAMDLKPEHYDHLIRLIRASASMFRALERWQTGAELLDIWKGEVDEELEDANKKG